MLSKDLRLLQVWWDEVLSGACEFTAEGAREFSRQLGKAVVDAEAIEELVPPLTDGGVTGEFAAMAAEIDEAITAGKLVIFRPRARVGVPFTDGRSA